MYGVFLNLLLRRAAAAALLAVLGGLRPPATRFAGGFTPAKKTGVRSTIATKKT